MSSDVSPRSRLVAWAQLVRLPNVFTVLADVGAAFLLIAHAPVPPERFVCVLAAGVALYWAGLILNDLFDLERDRAERPAAPLAAGAIPVSHARLAGWSLLAVGVLLAAISGSLPSEELAQTPLPGIIAAALAGLILAYDGPLKQTPLAPATMGGCRVLSFLLGAAPCIAAAGDPVSGFPRFVVAIALGFGIYITGITTIARHEATGGRSPLLLTGLIVVLLGAALLAFGPLLAPRDGQWHLAPRGAFPMLIGLIALPVILRAVRVLYAPSPVNIQNAVRVGILSVIPFAAAFAYLGAGAFWGALVLALLVPSIAMATKFRVT